MRPHRRLAATAQHHANHFCDAFSRQYNVLSPSRPSRPSSRSPTPSSWVSDEPGDDFPPFDAPDYTPDSFYHPSPLPPFAADFETDPALIDVPQGEEDSYRPAAPEIDAEDGEDMPEAGSVLFWVVQEFLMALEALEAIRLLLYVPPAEGKRKRTVPTKINGWSRQHLVDICGFLNLYMAKGSKTRGKWMESSVQAVAAAKGSNTSSPYGTARLLRSRARKYVLEREIPVNPFGKWARSKLETHPELTDELKEHLVNIGKYVQATDIITFMNRTDVQGRCDFFALFYLYTLL
ncbi:hypothetical protein B0H10DRAFT_1944454 [Mycena sp. CBHHK59/15]|nr:hypothetical protein B0H10DRAFT_1944454 [Mycena sp. CBHHK59/15]